MKSLLVLLSVISSSVYGQADSLYHQPNHDKGRIYMSVDRGVNWTRADKGFPSDASVRAWTTADGLVVAGTDQHGVFISSDGMKSWYGSSKGLPRGVRILSTVFTGNLIFVGTQMHGLYYSDDRGNSWRPSGKGLTYSNGLTANIRVLYHLDRVLFAGTDNGLYVSGDEGTSWSLMLEGLQINSLKSSKKDLIIATNKGALRSPDLGKNWTWIYSQGAIGSLTFYGNEVYMLDYFAKVYKATKDNYVWIKADIFLPFRYTFRITPQGRHFFISDWNKALSGVDSTEEVLWPNGIPEDLFIGELLDTPFGVLASVGNGC